MFHVKCYQLNFFKYSLLYFGSPSLSTLFLWWIGWRGSSKGYFGSDNLICWYCGDEIHSSKAEIEIHSALLDIAFIPFPPNKQREARRGKRHMQIRAINFSWTRFILKLIKMNTREVVIKQKMELTTWKMVKNMTFLSGCFASQWVSVFWQECTLYEIVYCVPNAPLEDSQPALFSLLVLDRRAVWLWIFVPKVFCR